MRALPIRIRTVIATTTPIKCRYLSSVIYSTTRKRPRLSALHLRDTVSLLKPEYRYLAPCWGAALSAASPLAGNLTRIGKFVHPEAPLYFNTNNGSSDGASSQVFQASRLARHVFFELIRESPWHVTRSKSLPAAYVTPPLIGTLWGLGVTDQQNQTHFQSHVRRTLREHDGIKSNYIHETEWTGVSLARWMDLVRPSSMNILSSGDCRRRQEPPILVSAVWLMVLWERSTSKLDFLECLIRLQETLPSSHPGIFDMTNPLTSALLNEDDSNNSSSSVREEWAATTFSEKLDLSPNQVNECYDRINFQSKMGQGLDATSLEVLCAALSVHHLPLQSKPAVPTGYYGFDGGDIQADCAEMTVREVINLLLWDEEHARFDVGRLPSTAAPCLWELYDESKYSFEESGGAWFDLVSDLPGCDYFLKSPNGRPYELVPSISNIVKVLQILLLGGGEARSIETLWKTFQDVSEHWQNNNLQVYESTLTHRSKTSGNLIHHEFATLRLKNTLSGIELRLRYDMQDMSGISKVTHMRERQPMLHRTEQRPVISSKCPTMQMLDLCLMGDLISDVEGEATQENSSETIMRILGTAYGCDRRTLLTRDLSDTAIAAACNESSNQLKAAIVMSCHQTKHDELWGATLLPWLLQESPSVFESNSPVTRVVDKEIEESILSLPINVLGNNTVSDALEFNPAVRGKPLKVWAQWKAGSMSMIDALGYLGIHDVPTFLTLVFFRW